jgi:plasmid replication initiation protein
LISDIKKKLELGDKYDRFSNFKTRVLDAAKKEINKFSDLNFDYKIIKLGRSPYQIEFSVNRKQPIEDKTKKLVTKVSTTALEKAKKRAIEAGTGWDIYAIEEQFYAYTKKAGFPKNLDAAFIGFAKKKVLNKA